MIFLNSLAGMVRVVVETLLNSIWQGIALTAVVFCLLCVFRQINAATRYLIWFVILLVVVSLPLLNGMPISSGVSTISSAIFGVYQRFVSDDSQPDNTSLSEKAAVNRRPIPFSQEEVNMLQSSIPNSLEEIASEERAGEVTLSEQTQKASALDNSQPTSRRFLIPLLLGRWSLLLFFGWILTTMGMLVRVVKGYRYAQRLKQSCFPLAPKYQDRFHRWLKSIGIRRGVRLCGSHEIHAPMAIGLIKPVILIPRRLVDGLTDAEFDLVLLHELAHLKRWDDWTNFAQKLTEALLFFHPAVWWIGRRLYIEREIACDDWVVALSGESRSYAFCLTKLIEFGLWLRRPAVATGAAWSKKNITRRIEMLLDKKRNATHRFSKLGVLAILCALTIAFVSSIKILPVVALTESSSSAVEPSSQTKESAEVSDGNKQTAEIGHASQTSVKSEQQQLVSELAKALRNESEEVRLNIVEVLKEIGQPAVPALTEALSDESEKVREKAADAIGDIGEKAQAAVPALIEMLNDVSEEVRVEAADALGDMRASSQEAISALIKALSDESKDLRRIAAEALGNIGEPAKDAVPALMEVLNDESEAVRRKAIEALGDISAAAKSAVPALMEILNDESKSLRRKAIEALGEIGTPAAPAVPALIKALNSKSDDIQEEASKALGKIGEPAIPELEKALRYGSKSLRRQIANLLGDIGEPAVPLLIEMLNDTSESMRREAADELGDIGELAAPAVPALMKALSDESERVRREATDALEDIGSVAAPALIKALNDPSESVRRAAADLLGDIEASSQETISALIQALNDESKKVRWEAADSLGDLKATSREAVSALIQILDDESDDVRRRAVEALGEIGAPAQTIVPALIKAMRDESEKVRREAAKALKQIGAPE
ncbi:TPA: hypothetical protein EYP66_13450 [Candidatus Poribacteria bacterium]|nr:hypothetical protein [Candidatus Poribacteria bacterium]